MPPAQAALEPSVGQDVSLGDHSCQSHGIFERQGVQRSAETNATSPLRSRRKHRQRICRDRKLLKEVVIDHGVHIESRLIRVLDLPYDLPGLVIMRLARRSLHLAIDSKSHQAIL